MYLLSYVPSLWFKTMDQRVLDLPHIQGDLSKVNIDPSKVDHYQALFGDREVSTEEGYILALVLLKELHLTISYMNVFLLRLKGSERIKLY